MPGRFGIKVIGRYEVDGDASTGIFAGARGHGSDTLEIGPPPDGPTVTISGKLNLAGKEATASAGTATAQSGWTGTLKGGSPGFPP